MIGRRPRERVLLLVMGGLSGLALAADYVATAEPDAAVAEGCGIVCDCPLELADTTARLDTIESTLVALDANSPGLTAYDALGNALGQVLNVKQGVDFIEYRIFNKTLNAGFWDAADGTPSTAKVYFAGADCTGAPYGVGMSFFTDGDAGFIQGLNEPVQVLAQDVYQDLGAADEAHRDSELGRDRHGRARRNGRAGGARGAEWASLLIVAAWRGAGPRGGQDRERWHPEPGGSTRRAPDTRAAGRSTVRICSTADSEAARTQGWLAAASLNSPSSVNFSSQGPCS